jgi:hypothetical protein
MRWRMKNEMVDEEEWTLPLSWRVCEARERNGIAMGLLNLITPSSTRLRV